MRSVVGRLPRPIQDPIRGWWLSAKRRRMEHEFVAAVAASSQDLRIHVGAGGNRLQGWLNTDIDGSAEFYLDATRPWPVPNGAAAFVFGDDFIEHLTLDEARSFLAHARHALRPGGVIRLATPDAAKSAEAYIEGRDLLHDMLERHRRNGYRVEYSVDVLRIAFAESGHWRGYIYDQVALTTELSIAGFVEIQACEVGKSTYPELIGLEARSEPIENAIQLVIEGTVPRPARLGPVLADA